MKNLLLTLMILTSLNIFCQNVSEIKPSTQKFGTNKLKKNPKKIYIANFLINFEVYREVINYKQGSSLFGTAKGEAMANAAAGLNGLDEKTLQEKCNQLYNEFTEDLKNKGFEIINADIAGKTETYEDYEKVSGPFIVESGISGILTAVPSGFSYYTNKKEKPGKEKKFNFVPQKLSKELDNAVIVDVHLYYMFTSVGEDWIKGNSAKVKLNTNFRLVDNDYTSAPKTNKYIGLKGAQTFESLITKITFTQGKIGLGAETQYIGQIKEPIEIDGVITEEKMVIEAKQTTATATSITPVVIAGPSYSEGTKWIDVDSTLFSQGIYLAGNKFIKHHLNEFFENYKN